MLAAIALGAMADVKIAEVFPDEVFRNYIATTFDTDGNGTLSDAEIAEAKEIKLKNAGVTTFKGVEWLTALEVLNVSNNKARSLDLSYNKVLQRVYCDGNNLNELIVSPEATGLGELYCYHNNIRGAAMDRLIESLPVCQKNTNWFVCVNLNEDKENNVYTPLHREKASAKNWQAKGFNSEGNYMYDPEMVEITAEYFPDQLFRYFVANTFDKNYDGRLDYTELEAITTIDLSYSGLTSLKGVEYFRKLTYLDCSNNALTELDLLKNTRLEKLYCSYNQLTSLKVSGLEYLTTVTCNYNQLADLDASYCQALTSLTCVDNKLLTLNIYQTALTQLHVPGNLLTAIDLKDNTTMKFITCSRNQLSAAATAALVDQLPTTTDGVLNLLMYDADQNVCSYSTVTKAKKKGWTVNTWRVSDWIPYMGSSVSQVAINETNFPDATFRSYVKDNFDTDGNDRLSEEEIANAKTINVFNKQKIKDMTGLEHLTMLEELDCSYCPVGVLNVSKNTALRELECYDCGLTSLDVTNNPLLEKLICLSNDLEEIDVTKCPELTELNCRDMKITCVDLRNSKKLKRLYVSSSPISSLDVSACTSIQRIDLFDTPLRGEALDDFILSLPTVKNGELWVYQKPKGTVKLSALHVKMARERGFETYYIENSMSKQVYDGEPGAGSAIKGDVNEDGHVDVSDIANVIDIMAGK